MRLHLQPHLFAAERSRELLFPVISPDARRNACLQEHSDEAAHEPQRGEVGACHPPPVIPSDVRNSLALYHLQGDPSTPLRSVFGMTYKEKAPSLRELAAEQMRSSLKELLLFKSTIFNYSFRHGCAVPPPSWREA